MNFMDELLRGGILECGKLPPDSERKYVQAYQEREQANNKCLAELFAESCVGNPYITDEHGNWLSKEEVYEKLLRGDKR